MYIHRLYLHRQVICMSVTLCGHLALVAARISCCRYTQTAEVWDTRVRTLYDDSPLFACATAAWPVPGPAGVPLHIPRLALHSVRFSIA